MANTFDLLSSYTVGAGGVSYIEITSIPATYTDLILKLSLRTGRSDTTDPVQLWLNNNTTGTSYAYKSLWTTSSTSVDAYSNTGTSNFEVQYATAANSTASLFNNYEVYFPNYASDKYKNGIFQSVHQQVGGASYLVSKIYQWANTSAISSIKLQSSYSVNISQYSTAVLYGIKKN